jgi:hypothetical protein
MDKTQKRLSKATIQLVLHHFPLALKLRSRVPNWESETAPSLADNSFTSIDHMVPGKCHGRIFFALHITWILACISFLWSIMEKRRWLTYLTIIFGVLPLHSSRNFSPFTRNPDLKDRLATHLVQYCPVRASSRNGVHNVHDYPLYTNTIECLCWNPETGVPFWAHEYLKYLKKTFDFIIQIEILYLLFQNLWVRSR